MPSLALVLLPVLLFNRVLSDPNAGPNPQLSPNLQYKGPHARFMFNGRLMRVNRGFPMLNQGLPNINRLFIDESDTGNMD